MSIIVPARARSARYAQELFQTQKVEQVSNLHSVVALPRTYDRAYLRKALDRQIKPFVDDAPLESLVNQTTALVENHIQTAGRDSVVDSASVDPDALGYARLGTGRENCAWCNMLIARGAVYKTANAALLRSRDNQPYHDNCDCIAIPVFTSTGWPGYEDHIMWERTWKRVTKGLSGKAALKEFRRWLREQQSESAAA